MNNNPESYNLEEILAGYVLGNLEEEEIIWLKQQLQINPELEIQIKQLETSLNLMPYGLPEYVRPSVNLREKILSQQKSLSVRRRPLKDYLMWLIGGFTTISTVWLGINNYDLRQQLASTNDRLQDRQEMVRLMRQPNNRLVSLTGSQQLPQASGSLLVSSQQQKAVLTLQNLKPLYGDRVYRLWAISQGEKTGCINFTPDENGRVYIEFSDDSLKKADAVLITVESRADTSQPTGNAMITGYY